MGVGLHQVMVRVWWLCIEFLGKPIELMLLDVVNDRVGQEILDALTPSHKQSDLAGRNIVEDCLLDHLEILSISPQQIVTEEERPYIGSGSLHDHAPVLAQDVMELSQRRRVKRSSQCRA